MTDTNDKVRSLFLAALMVFSVFAGTVALSGTAAAANVSDADRTISNNAIVYHGQIVAVESNTFTTDENVTLRSGTPSDPGTFQNTYVADGNGQVAVDTSELEADQKYFLQNQDGTENVTFEVVNQSLTANLGTTELGDAGAGAKTELSFDSNRQSFSLAVTADDLSASELEAIFNDDLTVEQADLNDDEQNESILVSVDRNTDYTLNASGIDEGNYNLEFAVTDTTATDSTAFNVSDISAGDTSFETANVEVPKGGIATFNISLDGAASAGTLVIGDEATDGYQANVSFEDGDGDGNVVVKFNTYAAGSGNGSVVWTPNSDDDVSLTSQTNISSLLAQGEYSTAVSTTDTAEATLDSPQDLGTMFIANRSTGDMTLWTAPSGTNLNADGESGVTESDLSSLIDDGAVTQDSTITSGDYLIHQVSATGLEGVLNEHDTLQSAVEAGAVSLSITQSNPVQNRDPKTINVSESYDAITFVKGDGNYYVVVDTSSSSLEVERNGENASIAPGDEFQASFSVTDERLLGAGSDGVFDSGDYQSASATFEVEEASTSLSEDPVTVGAMDNQSITGTTNLAPGTELVVRIRSTGDTEPRFFDSDPVTVNEDGSFNATFDFSNQAVGDTFSVAVTHSGDTVASADGEVVNVTTTSNTTTNGTTMTSATTSATTEGGSPTTSEGGSPTTTEGGTPTTDGDSTDATTTTEESSPGFGIAVALVALLAAALLAVRRD